jgi:hypothetical protein
VRLWTLHPRYLDPQGLVALWREALLARAVLRDETRGYRQHPQLERFRAHASPRRAIDAYLAAVHDDATARGYAFDRRKIGALRKVAPITATNGQVQYEWAHLLRKLSVRNPAWFERWRDVEAPACHPLFVSVPGTVAAWERVPATGDSAPQDGLATAIPSGIASTG